jgi:hypothetical protein
MTIRNLILSGLFVAVLASGEAVAVQPTADIGRVFKVDDTGTVVLDPVLEMQWQPPGEAGSSSVVSGATRVSVQLNLAAWVGRSGRIYMTLPRTTGPTVRASWKTGGTLLPGTMASGDRTLVFAGAITGPVMRDLIDMQLRADGALLAQPEALAFGFEIELDQ